VPDSLLTIDLDALAANHALLGRNAGSEVIPVVKADGYGLGAAPVARRLQAEGARSFYVARLSEGEALRAALPAPAIIYVLDGRRRTRPPASAPPTLPRS
jgi:alanine racemase